MNTSLSNANNMFSKISKNTDKIQDPTIVSDIKKVSVNYLKDISDFNTYFETKLKQKSDEFKSSKVIESRSKYVQYVPYSKDLKLQNSKNNMSLIDTLASNSPILENPKETPQSIKKTNPFAHEDRKSSIDFDSQIIDIQIDDGQNKQTALPNLKDPINRQTLNWNKFSVLKREIKPFEFDDENPKAKYNKNSVDKRNAQYSLEELNECQLQYSHKRFISPELLCGIRENNCDSRSGVRNQKAEVKLKNPKHSYIKSVSRNLNLDLAEFK